MNAEVREAITWSAAAMQNAVWPVVGSMVGGGRLVPVETVTSAGFARELDLFAGIDAWQIIDQAGIVRGLASRVQERVNYRTFTIRYKLASGRPTEYQKRLAELDARDGRLRPHLICQAFITDKTRPEVLSAAVARMSDVINAVRMGYATAEKRAPGGNVFRIIPWSLLQELGSPVSIYEAPHSSDGQQLTLSIEDL